MQNPYSLNAPSQQRREAVDRILDEAAAQPSRQPQPQPSISPAEAAYFAQQRAAQEKAAALGALGVSGREMAIAERIGVDPLAVAARRKINPGRAAYDPNAEVAQQVAVPVTSQRSVTGGNKYSEADIVKYQKASISAADASLERQRLQASAQETFALNRALVDDINLSDEAKSLGKQELLRQEGYDKITKEIEGIASTKTDQTRLFKDRGALSTILSSVGSVLQQYGAARAGQFGIRTMFLDEIANDIASQEREIRMKGDAAKGKLADFTRRFDGDIERGKIALRAAQQQTLASRLENMEIAARSPATKAALAENKAAIYKDIERDMMELHAANRGTITEAVNMQMRTPQAGYAGSVGYDLTGLAADAQNQRERSEDLTLKLGEAKNAQADKQTDTYQKAATELGELDEAQATIDRTMKLLGATRDTVTGEWALPSETPAGLGFVGRKLPKMLQSSEGMRNSQNVDAIVAAATKQLAGPGAITDEERALFAPIIRGDGSIEGFINGVNAAQSSARAKQKALTAKYGQETVDVYNQNKSKAAKNNAQTRIASEVTPADLTKE